jgi:acyl-CoA reductase-like NAD-dependent aldehyde dehydrogenase
MSAGLSVSATILSRLGGTVRSFVGDSFVEAGTGTVRELVNPATEEVIGVVEQADGSVVDLAVQAAGGAQRDWWRRSPAARGERLWKLAELVERDARELGLLDTLNIGKPVRDSISAAAAAAGILRYWAGKCDKIWGDHIPTAPGHLTYTSRVPLGVVGAIIPWNGPTQSAVGRIAVALGCGNAIVLKPSEYSPLSALRLAELCLEAGLPGGLVNVIAGGGDVGAAITEHPGIEGITFIGSIANGRRVNLAAAATMKKVTLELGGKTPSIVFADADLDEALHGVAWGVFSNTGQVCVAGTRLLVERSVAEEFTERLSALAGSIRVGMPDADVHLGPVANAAAYEKVRSYLDVGRQEGARLRVGGGRPGAVGEAGYFVAPAIFTEVENGMRISQEEIFGPVLSVLTFEGEEEALRLANDVEYGLSAIVWTSDTGTMLRMAEGLEAGNVWGNTARLITPSMPFGGVKNSGLGNGQGEPAVEGNTQVKRVSIRFSTGPGSRFAGI